MTPETLILLPGLICDATAWAPQQAHFSRERPVIVADYGDAGTLKAMARSVLDIGPDRFAIAGHSMGARVALELMELAPERVTRLALLDTGARPIGIDEKEKRLALLVVGRNEGMARLVDEWLPPMIHPDRRGDATFMAPLRDMAMRAGVERYARQIGALIDRGDARPQLASIRAPVLVGVGDADRSCPPAQHHDIAASIKGATLSVFPDSGHMAPVEAPEVVNQALARWLASAMG